MASGNALGIPDRRPALEDLIICTLVDTGKVYGSVKFRRMVSCPVQDLADLTYRKLPGDIMYNRLYDNI